MDNSVRPLNPDFVLNQPRYQGAQILLTRENFGCGSSREHAPWALLDYGFRVVIAPSFADIFFNNCFKNGILPIVLDAAECGSPVQGGGGAGGLSPGGRSGSADGHHAGGHVFSFEVDSFRKYCLLNGLDDIGLTLQHADKIKAYEERRSSRSAVVVY